MKDETLSRARRVTDRRTAAVFSDPLRRRLVLLFVGKERSLADVAQATGLELKRLHYHVTALRKRGLVKVTRTQQRAGRPIKFYRAVSDVFFVPEEAATSPPHAALHAELRKSIATLRDPALEGMLYHLGDDGSPRMRAVQRPLDATAPYGEQWRVLHLSPADAAHMARDIDSLLKSFGASHAVGTKPYLVHFAFAPSLSGATPPSQAATKLPRR